MQTILTGVRANEEPTIGNFLGAYISMVNLAHEHAKDSNINMDIFVGNEIYITHQMVDLLKEHKASTLNNSRYVLYNEALYRPL